MLKLVIGNKNYSSWSMRPWVLLSHFNIVFDEVRIPLFTQDYQQELAKYSPSLKVPVLIDGDTTIWDSLAICEYVSEKYLGGAPLPSSAKERALCRAYCAEMHAGFFAIRNQLPMNCRARKKLTLNSQLETEIARIQRLWDEAREKYQDQGPYLFGEFSIADAFYAPVVMRFLTYGISLSPLSEEYLTNMVMNEAIQSWVQEAQTETEVLPDFELGEPVEFELESWSQRP
ncbi:MAG: glutathione S-transferase family protein [Pseudomonadales bacterium]|nr:glutathione S-transferase family protein [Pseudomonadales bacterium]